MYTNTQITQTVSAIRNTAADIERLTREPNKAIRDHQLNVTMASLRGYVMHLNILVEARRAEQDTNYTPPTL